MFIPLRTDRESRRRPLVTEALIVANLAVYLAGLAGRQFGWFDMESLVRFGHFDPQHVRMWQLVTYQFVHDPGDVLHVAFNMLFLWVFGEAVEDRLRRLGFLGFYLAGGVVAALGHALVSRSPVIGASGAVSAVAGAYMVLFPRSRVRTIVLFMLVDLPAVWLIGIYVGLDILRAIGDILGMGAARVAYMAHIAGYLFGFAVPFVLLWTKVLRHEESDLFFLLRQRRRRAAFRRASRDPVGGLYESASRDTGDQLARRRRELTPQERALMEARAAVHGALGQGDLGAAADAYRRLLAAHGDSVLAESTQLDVANRLMADGHRAEAARAYALYLEHYGGTHAADEVRLLLGVLYARHLDRPGDARPLLEQAAERLRGDQRALAQQVLEETAA